VAGGAADAEDEEAAAGVAGGGEAEGEAVDGVGVDAPDHFDALVEERAAEGIHASIIQSRR
jgi:hypothetical protein